MQFRIEKEDGIYFVVEVRTNSIVGSGSTKAAAIADAKENLRG